MKLVLRQLVLQAITDKVQTLIDRNARLMKNISEYSLDNLSGRHDVFDDVFRGPLVDLEHTA